MTVTAGVPEELGARLLRAAGASSRQVFRLFAMEVATVALAGVPVGVVAGLLTGGRAGRLEPSPRGTRNLIAEGTTNELISGGGSVAGAQAA